MTVREREVISEEVKNAFEELWKLYPRKQGKKLAIRSYKRLLDEHTHEELLQAVKNFCEDKEGKDIQYLPHGSRFFSVHYLDYIPRNYTRNLPVTMQKKEPKTIVKHEMKGYSDYLKLMKSMPYPDYIQTEHWLHFKKEALIFFGSKCQLCSATDKEIHIHHKTYENRGRETFNDVIPLCCDCHKLVHGL